MVESAAKLFLQKVMTLAEADDNESQLRSITLLIINQIYQSPKICASFGLGQTAAEVKDNQIEDRNDTPTPDNVDSFSDLQCDYNCGVYSLFATFLMFMHLFFMMGPMHGWAEGSIILLYSTLMTII